MVSYHRLKSGHITCYLNRTYHVLLTSPTILLAISKRSPDSSSRKPNVEIVHLGI
jgi:hypothetical protein